MDLVAGTLLDRLTIGPPIMLLGLWSMPARPMPGCPTGLPVEPDIPQSPAPAIGGRLGIPIGLFGPPGNKMLEMLQIQL